VEQIRRDGEWRAQPHPRRPRTASSLP
jgi:hypothetical protein